MDLILRYALNFNQDKCYNELFDLHHYLLKDTLFAVKILRPHWQPLLTIAYDSHFPTGGTQTNKYI